MCWHYRQKVLLKILQSWIRKNILISFIIFFHPSRRVFFQHLNKKKVINQYNDWRFLYFYFKINISRYNICKIEVLSIDCEARNKLRIKRVKLSCIFWCLFLNKSKFCVKFPKSIIFYMLKSKFIYWIITYVYI